MGSQTTEGKAMSFRDSVKDNTKSVMIQTFITSLFSDPHVRFGDILEDLIETDDPDDDWMRETLYDLEIGQLVRAGAKVMGLDKVGGHYVAPAEDDDGVVVTETEDGTEYSLDGDDDDGGGNDDEEEVGPAEPPRKKRKKKKKKKKPKNPAEAAPKKKKKKKKSKPTPKQVEEADVDPEWRDYLKLIVKGLRTHKAYDEDTAVNNGAILNHIHGEDNWDKVESADLRRGIEDLVKAGKVSKVGQRRGTRYHLN